ncbi:uncharacterized protein HMPREF1541_10217 [Cyphellophora europaea CBS 101466]|uniref:Uncharacterized protein n=1 Tax=Cyphellophora europaea (strain CBS 101466) TaxID=1220924 RepID=W2S782_CYPE1|nr:uncharacterized protein HMPREF1541_10217 [Cyphellophora europaea CBS 101466]ETN44547.1 hypothetical protein HMPREF1541_10217 [Cyphellophora europaea CBS 101466]
MEAQKLRKVEQKPRVFVISDISNEPDDAESLVRFLLYSNEFDVRGLVACTSTWMPRVTHCDDMEKVVRAYGQVVDNLNAHVHPDNTYQPAKYYLDMIKSGPQCYGKEALAADAALSEGTSMLLQRLDESEEPLWVLFWGGTNTLAQALQYAKQTRSDAENTRLRAKLRVYTISDQDDTSMWIRTKFPDIFYISSIHGWNRYGLATWTGIAGETHYGFDAGGPDSTKISKDWIKRHIQIGPLGAAYPDFMFIPEGDTPTFLYLIQNGLGSPEHPDWGSWGGRYMKTDIGGASNHYSDVPDHVVGQDGRKHASNQATIWRWRDAYQNDFAARMQWSLHKDFAKCNHAPIVVVNDSTLGPEPLHIEAEVESEVVLDASKSYDPDAGDELTFNWMHYKDCSATQWSVDQEVPDILVTDISRVADGQRARSVVRVKMPGPEKCAVERFSGKAQEKGMIMHLVLSVTDNGKPALTTYKRVVVQLTNPELKGGRDRAVDSIAEVVHANG